MCFFAQLNIFNEGGSVSDWKGTCRDGSDIPLITGIELALGDVI